MSCFEHSSLIYKMNDMLNKFLLAGDNIIPEMHLSASCEPFTKNKESLNKLKTQDIFTKMN